MPFFAMYNIKNNQNMKKKFTLITLMLCIISVVYSQSSLVSTIAGSISGSADGTGTAAQFNLPNGLCSDAIGNVYVADQFNHLIRKITPAGVVTTFAGSTSGSANGTGISAQFFYPAGVCSDATGNLYVADQFNHLIRKITPAGVVSTFAGSTQGSANGTGAAAQFNLPSSVCADAVGNIYVADNNNHKIRKITSTGVVTTFAGSTQGFTNGSSTTAQFNLPTGVCVDASGNVYVADRNNNKIRKITSAGVVSTFAGSTSGYMDGTSTSAQFNLPISICIDGAGFVYVSDNSNNKIRKITSTGVVSTLAGSVQGYSDGLGSAAQFYDPSGICTDASGNIFVADYSNNKIRKIALPASSLNFDGVDDYIERTSSSMLPSGNSERTAEAWIKTSGTDWQTSFITILNYGTSILSQRFALMLDFGTGNFYFAGQNNDLTSGTFVADGNWHHVAASYAANGTLSLYVDGLLKASASMTLNTTGTNLRIGRRAVPSSGENFKGNIDEVRIWNRALCQSEIQNNMNGEIATTAPGLVANYHFNQGFINSVNTVETTLNDATTNNNATLNGFTLNGSTSNWVNPSSIISGSVVTTFTPPLHTATTSKMDIPCNGLSNGTASVTVVGGSNPYTYLWSTGATTSVITGQTAGVKTVTVTNTCGGITINTITITQPSVLSPTASQTNVACNGGNNGKASITASGGTSGYTYSWSPSGGTGSAATNLNAGNYNCLITDANSCSKTQSVIITQPTAIALNASTNNTLMCTGNSSTLTANASGGTGTITYSWVAGSSTSVNVVSPATTTIYTVNCTDANGCFNVATITQSVSICTGIDNLTSNISNLVLQVYPNPTNGMLNVELNTINENTKVEILNALGQVIVSEKNPTQYFSFNIYNYPAGVYFVKATFDSKTSVVKIMKE